MAATAKSMLTAVLGELQEQTKPSSPLSPAGSTETEPPVTLTSVAATVNALVPTVNNHERLLQQMPPPTRAATLAPVPPAAPAAETGPSFNLANFFFA